MTAHALDLGLMVALQHLWQGALLLVLVAWSRRGKHSAEAHSWVVLLAFLLAAASPLAVLLPQASMPAGVSDPSTRSALMHVPFAGPSTEFVAAMASRPRFLPGPAEVAGGLALIWLLGFLCSLTRLWQGWRQADRMRRGAQRSLELERLLAHELPGNASVAFCDTATSPMVVGLLRPCILMPVALGGVLAPAIMIDLLRHEAAHIRRRDLWVSLLQRLLLGVYWWSPFMRRLGGHLDLAREMACDERAARRSGNARRYAGSLLDGARRLAAQPRGLAPLAVGMSGERSGLAQRVDDLLERDARWATRRKGIAWGMACLVALSAQVGLTLAATPRMGNPSAAVAAGVHQLLDAAGAGQLAEVRRLVASGVDVDTPVPGDGTALIVAARNGQLGMIDQLLALGARPDRVSIGDGNALIAASAAGHLPIVARLIAAGADVNGSVVHDETPLINASRSGQLPVVKYLVEHGADVNLGVLADNGQWRSPLNQAGSPDIRAYLSSRGAVPHR